MFNGVNDAYSPYGTLTLAGSTLYGMSHDGGSIGIGAAFKINTDGTGYSIIHSFGSGADGSSPWGSLTASGSTLLGVTPWGGAYGMGTAFSMNTDGADYTVLRNFGSGIPSQGAYPYGSLTHDGSTLYGMTAFGGAANKGVVFKMNTDGGGYSVVHTFTGGGNDGNQPFGSLTLDGSTLYGMTSTGGDSNLGVVFKVGTDGSGFSLLHEFDGSANDGASPQYDSLALDGSTLYGMTSGGGGYGAGVVFQVNTDGTGFSLLHEFNDGGAPYGSVILGGSTLYGMTSAGGASGMGNVFALQIPEPNAAALMIAGMAAMGFTRRSGRPARPHPRFPSARD